ncbi:MAG: hypothetical protein K2P94_13480 [Rhodospirillaceae bacterium]|nr:hypothetical protein [Rhodospirillaceae bacterium]
MKSNFRLLPSVLALSAIGVLAAVPAGAQNKTPCADMSRNCLIEVARAYIDARADGRARPLMRLAPDLMRWENGLLTATKSSEIAGPADGVVSKTLAVRDANRVLVDGDEAVFFWLLDRREKPEGPYTATVHLIERFKFAQGKACGDVASPCISEIEVVFCAAPHGGETTLPKEKNPSWARMYLCNREG